MKVTHTIRGAKELETNLREMGPKVASRLGDRALRAAAKPIVKEAKRLVPVRTGELRRSITAVTSREGRGADERVVVIGFRKPASRRAHFVEFGTKHSPAKPFMRPALDSQHQEALKAMQESLAQGIAREEWKKALPLLAEGVDLFGDEE